MDKMTKVLMLFALGVGLSAGALFASGEPASKRARPADYEEMMQFERQAHELNEKGRTDLLFDEIWGMIDNPQVPTCLRKIETLLRQGVDLEGLDDDGLTPLAAAFRVFVGDRDGPEGCIEAARDIFERLLEEGADINCGILHRAVDPINDFSVTLEDIRYLLNHGADPNRTDKCGDVPLKRVFNVADLAEAPLADFGDLKLIKPKIAILIAHGAIIPDSFLELLREELFYTFADGRLRGRGTNELEVFFPGTDRVSHHHDVDELFDQSVAPCVRESSAADGSFGHLSKDLEHLWVYRNVAKLIRPHLPRQNMKEFAASCGLARSHSGVGGEPFARLTRDVVQHAIAPFVSRTS